MVRGFYFSPDAVDFLNNHTEIALSMIDSHL